MSKKENLLQQQSSDHVSYARDALNTVNTPYRIAHLNKSEIM